MYSYLAKHWFSTYKVDAGDGYHYRYSAKMEYNYEENNLTIAIYSNPFTEFEKRIDVIGLSCNERDARQCVRLFDKIAQHVDLKNSQLIQKALIVFKDSMPPDDTPFHSRAWWYGVKTLSKLNYA